MMKIFGFFVIILTVIDAQKLSSGKCPTVTPMANFNITKITGKWYEFSKYKTTLQSFSHCDILTITANGDGTYSYVIKDIRYITKAESRINSVLKVDNTVGNGKLLFAEPIYSILFNPSILWEPFYVLDTDYTNYVVFYSCVDVLGLSHFSLLWVYTRTNAPSTTVINNALAAIDRNGLDRSRNYYKQTDQLLCPSGW